MTNEIMNIEQLNGVAGGSWYVREAPATKGGITLKKSDGSPGSWG